MMFVNKTAKDHITQTYFEETADGQVVRWMSNDTVPPLEILTELFIAGYITREIHFNSMNAKRADDAAFLEQYVANRRKFGYSAEEKFEMRAAFAGETVVDVFTGEVVEYA
jgi:hypothetical protein